MDRFEYKCIAIWGGSEATSRTLNEYGRDGWELVCVWAMWHYLERRLPDDVRAAGVWNTD
jgi:hypothetical protein